MANLVIESKLFNWHPAIKEFSAEASVLEHELARLGQRRLQWRNGEWGFFMKSHRTGKQVWWYRYHEHMQQGELLSVEFRCRDLEGVRLVVDND